jgi:hypothetical protein
MGEDQTTNASPNLTLRTSQQGWLAELTKAYRNREPILIIDDLNTGIDPKLQTLLQMGLQRKLTRNEWIAVGLSAGVGLWGITMVVLAIVDPDPTSKLGLLIASGAIFTFSGGFQAVRLLTNRKPPNIRASHRGIEIEWN